MDWNWTRLLLVGALGLAVGSTSGCAEEREPINRVQANALAKSFFVGADLQSPDDDPEFWTRAMVVDVGYGAAQDGLFSASWAQAELTRIKWQVTEDLLIGRIAYERIEGTDGKGVGGLAKEGVIAVAFKIVSHFDIRREYNPTTGEESNIIVENTTDRPWYEREYMRVDFSQNLNTASYDFDTLSLIGVFGGVSYEPLAYYVNDPTDEDAPHFDPASGYFDITTKAFATPELIDLSAFGWGIDAFPACYLDNDFLQGDAPHGSCNPVELTIRHSFRRVVDRDYEPVDWDGYRFQAYGPFLKERYGYARNYGMSDTKWHRFATRYNIWERSHYYADPASMTGAITCFTPETTPVGADPHRDDDGNGTEDECEAVTQATGVGGSRCDTFTQKCTLPFQLRKEVPQAWYVTNRSNFEYFEGTEWATHEWDVAMRSAVQVAKYAECMRTSGDPGYCNATFPVWHGQMDDNADAVALAREVDACRHRKAYQGEDCNALADRLGAERGYDPAVIATAKMPEMIVLCHSPVEAGDPEACGGPRLPEGMTAAQCNQARKDGDEATLATCNSVKNVRMGDLRHHTVNLFEAPQSPSSWGIYTDSEDPLTGEKVSASINVWTHINDIFSQSVIDQVRYIKGELKTEDVTEGTYVRDWAAASEAASRAAVLPKMTREQVDRKLADFAGMSLEEFRARRDDAVMQSQSMKSQVQEAARKEIRATMADAKAPDSMRPTYEARRRHAVGSGVEAALMTKSMQQLAGIDGLPISDQVLNYASPLRGMNPTVRRDMERMKELALAERGSCVLAPEEATAPFSLTGLADVLEEKFGAFEPIDSPTPEQKTAQFERAERMRKYIAQRAHYAVIIHEMGHSVGMRHNFVSSSDPWGYRPQYWQLRTKDGTVKSLCNDVDTTGESCVGPRYFDPVTETERKNLIWMFMQSTTMDYAGELTQDLLGLGAYDFAAVRMFYGDAVAIHEDASYDAGTARGRGMVEKMDNFGGILGIQYVSGTTDIHYSDLQNKFELIKDCRPVDPNLFKPATWNEERDGIWHPTLDGLMVSIDGSTYTRCRQQRVDYAQWNALRFPQGNELGAFYRGGPAVLERQNEGRKYTRVPYGFATDRWADLGNLSVYRHDNGADPYELFSFFIAQQEVAHIFDNYRRHRQNFSVRSAADRTFSRYNTKMRDAAKGLGLYRNIVTDLSLELGLNPNWNWEDTVTAPFVRDVILASGIAFDHFARQMARPQPGPHYFPSKLTMLEPNGVPGVPGPGPGLEHTEVLQSADDTLFNYAGIDEFMQQVYGESLTAVVVPNGATGYYGDIGLGGKPLENALAEGKGEYDADFTMNAGAYYDKVNTTVLMTESVDNFISDSRNDFLDARYRAVSLADLFPDGYRRWLANNLTGDDFIKGPRILVTPPATPGDPPVPITDEDGYPGQPIAWTTWWTPSGPQVCWPRNGTTVCWRYGDGDITPDPGAPAMNEVAALAPQVNWEQQKFMINWTMMYLPENQQQTWLNQLFLWELGKDNDPEFQNRIEFHHPSGKVYVARTFGKEDIFGKTVQKGIAARVLEYANELLAAAYVSNPVTLGDTTWYVPVLHPTTGMPVVRFDPTLKVLSPSGGVMNPARTGCGLPDPNEPDYSSDHACTCQDNRACILLERYQEVPFFLRQTMMEYGLCLEGLKGIYDAPKCI